MTTKDTPFFLLSEFARQYRWLDLSDSVNRYVPELRAQGVEAIVVLAHAGAFQAGNQAAGEVIDETREMDDAVDVVIAGHTHSELNLDVDGKLVVEALSYGVAFDRVKVTVDRGSGDVVAKSALVLPTSHAGIEPDPEIDALVDAAARSVAPLANRLVGHAARRLGTAAVDRLAVNAQRAFAGADIAFLNPGNTRSDLEAGPISYAEAFEAQAYEHPVWRLRMSGSDLLAVMAKHKGLLVSGSRKLDPDVVYTVAANGIVAETRALRAGNRPGDRGHRSRGARRLARARARPRMKPPPDACARAGAVANLGGPAKAGPPAGRTCTAEAYPGWLFPPGFGVPPSGSVVGISSPPRLPALKDLPGSPP